MRRYICVPCQRELVIDKNGAGVEYASGVQYDGDRWRCPVCEHTVIITAAARTTGLPDVLAISEGELPAKGHWNVLVWSTAHVVCEQEGDDLNVDALTEDATSSEMLLLDGLEGDECFAEYLSGDIEGITGGYLKFVYDKVEERLLTTTRYQADHELTVEELDKLKDYTQGQWSDGIGENFEQQEVRRGGKVFYVSPWHSDQMIDISCTPGGAQ